MRRYHITVGAKTTVNGTVLTGWECSTINGLAMAREGDQVDCPECDSTGVIVCDGPHLVDLLDGRHAALDGDLCSCKCDPPPRLIANQTLRCQVIDGGDVAPRSRATAQPAAPSATNPAVAPRQSSLSPTSGNPTSAALNSAAAQEPGFYVVPKSTTREQLEYELFTTRTPAVMAKFRSLNPNQNVVKAGSMIVLSDPDNLQCTREEALLMEAAAKVHNALETLTPEEADFMARHRDEIETFLAQGSTAIGIGEAMFANKLANVKTALKDIEALHQRTFQRDGHLKSPEFFAERRQLLAKLDTHLTTIIRKGTGFPDHPNLKSALGISSRSLVHRWSQAGAPQQIPGYATHIEGVAKAARYVKYGGWIGTAIGGGASYLKVQEVCTAGDTEACERVKFTETGSFAGVIGGGAVAGWALSAGTVGGLCVGLGVPTGGAALVVCGVVVVGAAAFAGGAIGGVSGETIGEVIYEKTR